MPSLPRQLKPGETLIGFISLDGKLIGEFASPAIGHEMLALQVPGLRSRLERGQAIGITIGKRDDGTISVFGSAAFSPTGAQPLSEALKELARRLVE
jgi:hypothetical protein